MKPLLLITVGDPAGIGPEIALKSLAHKALYERCVPVLMCDGPVLRRAAQSVKGDWQFRRIDDPAQAQAQPGVVCHIESGVIKDGNYAMGEVSALCGEAAFSYVKNAIALAMDKKAAAVVTGPLNKEAMNLAGHHFSGHTEIFAHYTGTKDYAMMLASKNLRVIHVTTHVSLRNACELIKKERVLRTIQLAGEALRELGVEKGAIGVAGLNPHSSEHGLFGNEEHDAIIPAIKAAQASGMTVDGPVPPDTVFVKALAGQYDIVVAMYHDQGHIPLKLCGFKMDPKTRQFTSVNGINCTIGLPIIRTSVDHGTAFDQAGKGTANEESLMDAIDMAITMSANRFGTKA